MKIHLIKDPGYGWDDNIEYPITVEGERFKNTGFNVKVTTLSDAGFNIDPSDFTEDYSLYYPNNCVVGFETPCDTTNKCCNQFGERDEMQRIINSLQADVIARGARIKALEDKCNELQRRLDHNAQV